LVRHLGVSRNGGVNAPCLSTKIEVEGTEDDSSMACGSMLMKAEEVPAIVGQENPVLCHRERQNFHIRH
jgi:hypothetical protein